MRRIIRTMCEKCNREIKGILPMKEYVVSEATDERFLDHAEEALRGAHVRREHSFCMICGSKIEEGDGIWRFATRTDELSEEEKSKGVEFHVIPGLVCYRCRGEEE